MGTPAIYDGKAVVDIKSFTIQILTLLAPSGNISRGATWNRSIGIPHPKLAPSMMAQANYSTGPAVMAINMHDCSVIFIALYGGEHKTLRLGRKPTREQEHEEFETRNVPADFS